MNRRRSIALCSTVCVALAVLTSPSPLFALDPDKRVTQFVHTAWTPRDGAPSDLNYIAQTPDGYLWLGSPFTTFRFDGTRFLPWNPPSEWMHLTERGWRGALLVSRDGSLWMGLAEGLARISDNEFAWHKVAAEKNMIIQIVEEDDDHLLLLVTGSGLHRFNRRTGESSKLSTRDGLAAGVPSKLWQDRDGTIWVGEGEVWKGGTGHRFEDDDRDPVPYSTEHTIVYKPRGETMFRATGLKVGEIGGFAQGADGTIWLLETARSVRVLRTLAGRWLPPGPEIKRGSASALFDRHGSLWITTLGDGLRRVADPRTYLESAAPRAASRLVEEYTEEHGLSGDMLYVSFEDREGNLWFGGPNGLDRFRDVHLAELTSKEGVRLNMSYATIVPDDGGVAVASFVLNGVLLRINRTGALSSQHVYVDRFERLGPGCAPGGSNPVYAMYRSPDGVLWAAGTRLYRRDASNEWHCVPLRTGGETLFVMTLTTDGRGGLWLGTRSGLWRYASDGTLTHVEGTKSRNVTVLFVPPDGTIWFGGIDGLARLQDGRVVDVVSAKDLPRGGVYALFDAGRGDIGLLERSGLRLVRDDRVVKLPGLSETPIAGCWFVVRVDADLWFTCAHGLLRIPGAEWDALAANVAYVPAHELFNATDDLRSAPIRGGTAGSIAKADDGRIWFLTRKGVGYIEPSRIDRTPHPPPVYIDAAQSGPQPIDVKAPAARLQPLSQPLEISFSGISLGHPERLRFRYRLDGVDHDWRETRDRTVSYSQVPAGDYRLRVVAIDHQGTPSEHEAVWRFSVAPHWYERWWVGTSAVALTGLLIWGVAKVGMARQAVRLEHEFSLQLAERTRIARELHDTLLQTVQSSKILADEALTQTTDPDRMRRAIAQLSEWLGLAVREGRAALNSLRTSKADVKDDAEVKDLAEAFRRAADAPTRPAAMTVSVSVQGDPIALDPRIQHQVYRVGFEAIRNAFAHSAGTRLEIAIEYAHDLIVRIVDNGVGIEPVVSRSGKSGRFGLPGMRERARSIGATLTIDTSTTGTSVTLVVPRGRATEA